MKGNPIVAFALSLVIPGLGHMYAKKRDKGAMILAASIIIGSVNIVFVLAFASAGPDPSTGWAYWIPRIGHDVVAGWSIVFWLWACFDAYRETEKELRRDSL